MDSCSQGTAWDTWNQVEAYDFGAKDFICNNFRAQSQENEFISPSVKTWPSWMSRNFSSPGFSPADPASGPIYRWGNPKEGHTAPFSDESQLNDGPEGAIDQGECWDPSTFD